MAESFKARPFTKKERILSSASASKDDEGSDDLSAIDSKQEEPSISSVLDTLFSPPPIDEDEAAPEDEEAAFSPPPFLDLGSKGADADPEDDEVMFSPPLDPNPNEDIPYIEPFSVEPVDLDAELEEQLDTEIEEDLEASLAEDKETAKLDDEWEQEFDEEIEAPDLDGDKSSKGLRAMASGAGSAEDDELSYQQHEARVKMEAEQARKIMNLLATMGPVFKRVVGNSDSDDAAQLVSELLAKAESLKQKLYSVFNAKQEQQIPKWLKAQLSRYAVSMTTDNHTMSLDDMVTMSKQLSEFMPDLRYEYSSAVDDKMQIKLSMIKALSKIEVDIDIFYANLSGAGETEISSSIEAHRAEIVDDISSFIVGKVSHAMEMLSEPKSTARTRTMMAQSLIHQASEFYAASLSIEISNFWERLKTHKDKGKHKDFIEHFASRNPEGVPTSDASRRAEDSFDALTGSVEKEFDKQFDRLINFTYSKATNSSELKN